MTKNEIADIAKCNGWGYLELLYSDYCCGKVRLATDIFEIMALNKN